MDRQVIDVQEDPLRSPEAVLEFEKQSSRRGRERTIEFEVEQQIATGRPAEAEEGRVPLDPPAAVVVHDVAHSPHGSSQ